MKIERLVSAVAATAMLTSPAFSQIGIYIQRTPPPLRYEQPYPSPGDGYAWTEGYWGNEGGRYIWVPGRWQRPPYAGAYYSHPHYDHYEQGWRQHEGHWDHEDHGDHFDNRGDHHDEGHDRH